MLTLYLDIYLASLESRQTSVPLAKPLPLNRVEMKVYHGETYMTNYEQTIGRDAKTTLGEHAYHSYSGFTHRKGDTAQDIFTFEALELGNTDMLTQAEILSLRGINLSKLSARQCLWVATNAKQAEIYNRGHYVYEIPLTSNDLVLAEDGDEGYLVFFHNDPFTRFIKIVIEEQ